MKKNVLLYCQDSRSVWTSYHLMRRDEESILISKMSLIKTNFRRRASIHIDGDVRSSCCIIKERKESKLMKEYRYVIYIEE
jgi:hypothetical protein